jgi:hypothetical protein
MTENELFLNIIKNCELTEEIFEKIKEILISYSEHQ